MASCKDSLLCVRVCAPKKYRDFPPPLWMVLATLEGLGVTTFLRETSRISTFGVKLSSRTVSSEGETDKKQCMLV
jgi:hypothetical protein